MLLKSSGLERRGIKRWIGSSRQNYLNNNKFGMSAERVASVLEDKGVLIDLIDKLLTDILGETREMEKGSSAFHCGQPPAISVGDYLRRIGKFANCSHSIFVISLIYMDRLQECMEDLVLNHYCVHRLLITTIMVAAKYADDFFYKNEYYAKVGGIAKLEINSLEVQVVTSLNYHLYVSEGELRVYMQKLQAYREVNGRLQKPKLTFQ